MNRTDLQIAQHAADPNAKAGLRARTRLPAHCRTERSERFASALVTDTRRILRRHSLNTVCEEARCPNLAKCFARGTATFMLLGDVCTRTCRFCNVATGRPGSVDSAEPERIAAAAGEMGLTHVVLTSVNRDDLADGGSLQFERAITAVRSASPGATIEVLTPDFQGSEEAIDRVVAARPDVYNHNLETVPRLYRNVRPGARYARSLDLLERVARVSGGPISKSGLMLGLGETEDEVHRVMRDLRSAGVSCLTLGQYLQPTLRHLQVERYLDPAEFETLREHATALGFEHVASGPLVRSSFDAGSGLRLLREARGARVSV